MHKKETPLDRSRQPRRPALLSFAFLALLGTGFWIPLQAQSRTSLPPISTDRPSASESSSTVPRGTLQLEAGFAIDRFSRSAEGTRNSSINLFTPLLLRYGLLEHLELQLASKGFSWQESRVGSGAASLSLSESSGIASPAVGFKWNLLPAGESPGPPSVGLSFQADLPRGSRAFRPPKTIPRLNLSTDFTLSHNLALGANLGASLPVDGPTGERFAQLFFAGLISRSLNEQSGLFLEIFGIAPHQDQGQTLLSVDGGLTHRVSRRLQLDIALTRGVSELASDWAVNFGLGLRLF